MRKLLIVGAVFSFTACDMIGGSGDAPPAEGTPPAAGTPAAEGTPPAAGAEGAAPAAAPAADAKPSIGTIDAIEGEPVILRGEEQVKAEKGTPLQVGDKVKTPAKAKARMILQDKSVVAIGPDTEIKLAALDMTKGRKGSLEVTAGKFWMQVEKWASEGDSTWDVSTPNAVAGIRGTTLWGDTKVDAICALEGTIEVKSLKNEKAKPATLKAGNCASKLSKGKLAPMKPKPKQVQGYLKEVLIADAAK